jgi:hypothetical protein
VSDWRSVASAAELIEQAKRDGVAIELAGPISGMPMLTLAPGVRLRGGMLRFGAKGVQLTRDNSLEDVRIETVEHEPAILNDTNQPTLGTLSLERVTTVGQVVLVADGQVGSGHVSARRVHVMRADVRGRTGRPRSFGVEAMQGAFTLWNRQADRATVITADLHELSAGLPDAPVRGSGIFVAGHGAGGELQAQHLTTDEIHADGGIEPGTPDLISGGVFVVAGATITCVENRGSVTTYGANDMVLDNWGEVERWVAREPVTSIGPSGIGFVNFGVLGELRIDAPLATHGPGARGFNLYDGTLQSASFQSIATSGDGAVGIQVSKHLPAIEIRGDLRTTGGRGPSLVKGVQTLLPATAISIQPAGHVGRLTIGGRLQTAGDELVTLDVEGALDAIEVKDGIHAIGSHSDAVHVNGQVDGLERILISARDGREVVRTA